MQLSLAILSTLAILVQLTDAARLPFDKPGSPRSSVQGATEAKAAYRHRQAQSADVVRRLRDGPNRKRLDPSAAVCAIPSGTNVVQNGDFEVGTQSGVPPWTVTKDADIEAYYLNSGWAGSYAYPFRNNGQRVETINFQQTVTVCAGVPFNVAFDLGRYDDVGSACQLDITLTGAGGLARSLYSGSPCAAGECTDQPSTDTYVPAFKRYDQPSAITFTAEQAASPVTVQALFTCDAQANSNRNGKIYAIDNVVLARA